MKVARAFNYGPIMGALPGVPDWFQTFLRRLTPQLQGVARSLPGPTSKALGDLGAVATIVLDTADLITATLSANAAITLDVDLPSGAEGLLELTQDATGGRTASWVNALWTNSAAPVVAAGAGKRTLLGFSLTGSGWVGRVIATNY